MDPAHRLDKEAEKAVYDAHENYPDDPGYRRFVRPLFELVRPHLDAQASGLDFGCGAGSALMALFEEADFAIKGFDPFYANHPERLDHRYDFVVCSETAEHFYNPASSFEILRSLLHTGGLLGLMTRFHTPNQPLKNWFYAQDPTHVSLYSPMTCAYIAQKMDLILVECGENLALFQKRRATW